MRHKIIPSLLILLCVSLIAIVGCASIVDRLTPAYVAPQAAEYVGDEPQDIYSLHNIKVMQTDTAIKHRGVQIDLKRLAEDDEYAYQDALGFIETAIAEAELFQQQILGDDNNPLSVSGLLFMITGGLVGRSFFKRPQDYTPEQVQVEIAKVKNGGTV